MVFSQHDLAWIDNILPEKEKKETDKKKKRRKDVHENAEEEVGMVSLGRRQRLRDLVLPERGMALWVVVGAKTLSVWFWVLRPHLFLEISSGWSELVSLSA